MDSGTPMTFFWIAMLISDIIAILGAIVGYYEGINIKFVLSTLGYYLVGLIVSLLGVLGR